MNKSTKIVATIGPACADFKTLKQMALAGMNVARLNFSHGDHASHLKLIKNIRRVEKQTGLPLAIIGDIRGPRIRLDGFTASCIKVKTGEILEFVINRQKLKGKQISIDAPANLLKFLKIGHRVLIDDGRIEVKIKAVKKDRFLGRVVEGGQLCEHKGLNFPESNLIIPPLSVKDRADLEFCAQNQVEFIALSFVRTAKDVNDARALLASFENKHKSSGQPIKIIAKIERHEGVENIDEIIKAADGIMVARGDLGLEMAPASVPLAQKEIVAKANSSAKPVIVATQMLDSMQEKNRPTRAEVSDVANAVIDHADALMLSNETAAGKNPVLVVKTMAEIICATEQSSYDDKNLSPAAQRGKSVDQAISEVSRLLAENVGAQLILAASLTGETGRLISHMRPEMPIVVAAGNERAWRQLNLSWGVRPFILPKCRTIEELIRRSVAYIKKQKLVRPGQKIIVVAGEPVGQAGNVNLVEVREIK